MASAHLHSMTPPKETKTISVIGLDDFNRKHLESLPDADHYNILEGISHDALKDYPHRSIKSLLDTVRENLRGQQVDALVTWWDFPGTLMRAILNDEFGFPGPGLEEMLRCEHKYWSRREQRAAIPEAVPDFQA